MTTKPFPVLVELELLREVRDAARIVSDHMKLSPGGDAVTFTGSTNHVDELRAALDAHRDFMYQHALSEEGEPLDDDDED